jgi:hypothetical protein
MTTRELGGNLCDTRSAHSAWFLTAANFLGLQPRTSRRAVQARAEIQPRVNEECIHESALLEGAPLVLLFLPEITSDGPSLTDRNPPPPAAQRMKEQKGNCSWWAVCSLDQGAAGIQHSHPGVSHPGEDMPGNDAQELGKKNVRQLGVATCRGCDTKHPA